MQGQGWVIASTALQGCDTYPCPNNDAGYLLNYTFIIIVLHVMPCYVDPCLIESLYMIVFYRNYRITYFFICNLANIQAPQHS